jgi:hypothetical protein
LSEPWPEGRPFAFSVFDDTDRTTLANGPAVYDLLSDLGVLVTKSVWMDDPGATRTVGGATCADPEYLEWVLGLQERGHEIGFHNASDRSSTREQTRTALDRFEQVFGGPPRCGADHAGNAEALYAGSARVSGHRALLYRCAERVLQPRRPRFRGDDPESKWFWGDLCAERITYWRRFSFARTDLSSVGPVVHHDPTQPHVNAWFNSSHAPRLEAFLERVRHDRLDQLEANGGVCILYTHFGLDFVDERSRPDARFVRTMTALAERGGWFAPVSDVLDHLVRTQGITVLDERARRRMEWAWIADRVRDRARIGPSVPTHSVDA